MDVLLLQGNDITFVHFPEASETTEAGEKFSVLLHETVWQRLDRPGETASREYMMMALADILNTNPQNFIMEAYAEDLNHYETDPPNDTNPGVRLQFYSRLKKDIKIPIF